MSGGGKGGSQTTEVKIPKWLQDAAKQNISRADVLSTIGYTPYFGPDVAAMTPTQIAAMQGVNQAASAFGLNTVDPMAGMQQPQDFGGMAAYSSGGGFQDAVNQLMTQRPGQYEALTAPFIDPITGAAPASPFGALIDPAGRSSMGGKGGSFDRAMFSNTVGEGGGGYTPSYAGSGSSTTSLNTPLSYAPGGVNTRNPSGTVNRVAAALSGPQGAPTASSRPISRSSGVR
jgi:hypothetical protein